MEDKKYSADFIKTLLSICGVDTDVKLYNRLLKYEGSLFKIIKFIYIIIDLDLYPNITKHLIRIMPKSKKMASSYVADILNTKQTEKFCVKDVIDYFETLALEKGTIREKVFNAKSQTLRARESVTLDNNIPRKKEINIKPHTIRELIESGLSRSQAIKKYLKENKGKVARYSFRCSLCGHDRNLGRYIKCEDEEFEVCKFCCDNMTNYNASSKIIYTPMGNKR
jgi:CRISPR/Cas system-associated protein Cas10 (large subunit of type III CRISPR-Cas system)